MDTVNIAESTLPAVLKVQPFVISLSVATAKLYILHFIQSADSAQAKRISFPVIFTARFKHQVVLSPHGATVFTGDLAGRR